MAPERLPEGFRRTGAHGCDGLFRFSRRRVYPYQGALVKFQRHRQSCARPHVQRSLDDPRQPPQETPSLLIGCNLHPRALKEEGRHAAGFPNSLLARIAPYASVACNDDPVTLGRELRHPDPISGVVLWVALAGMVKVMGKVKKYFAHSAGEVG
jgi:hypothetical protein